MPYPASERGQEELQLDCRSHLRSLSGVPQVTVLLIVRVFGHYGMRETLEHATFREGEILSTLEDQMEYFSLCGFPMADVFGTPALNDKRR